MQDLDLALALDADKDRKVTANELQERFAEVQSYVLRHLRMNLDGVRREMMVTNEQPIVREFHDGASLALDFVVTNISHPTNLEVEYRFMFDQKPEDRVFMQVECSGTTQTGMFTADEPVQRFNLEARPETNAFRRFGWQGARHVWAGFDHHLFLLAWLLPAVLCRRGGHWHAVTSFSGSFLNAFKAVTAFAVANLLMLCVAAIQAINLPARWVDMAIAASIVLAATNNIQTIVRAEVWVLAFGFGLIHGLGFAGLLTEPHLAQPPALPEMLGWTLGLEAGQLAVVMALLPLVFALRNSGFYQNGILKIGSALIALVAGWWLLERLFNL